MKLLPCPFCGSDAIACMDGEEPRPFYVRCSRVGCPGHNTGSRYADGEMATQSWQRRAQPPPAEPVSIGTLAGFTKKSLIRGEMVCLTLDRTGVLTSDKLEFSPRDRPLMWKPLE